MEHAIRLNLGAGDRHWPGWVNVDCIGDQDLISDVTKLDLPDNHADEISAIHLFEHIERTHIKQTLLEWLRVLKPGGQLSLEMPCLDNVIALWNAGYRQEGLIGRALFGIAEPHTMQHKWCYSKAEIGALFAETGFQNVQFEEPFFHLPQRDLRIVGIKSKE